jgi:iron complex transport system substrate-binding protein
MKTKNVVFVGIAVCAISLLLISPVLASADETLDIYGNANEDDTIDVGDITYTARIIFRLEDETDLADADHNFVVNVADMTQIGLIILGRESELTVVDSNDRIVTLDMPIERIIVLSTGGPADPLCILEAEDKIVGINGMIGASLSHPSLIDIPSVGFPGIDYERVVELEPDVVITSTDAWVSESFGDVSKLESLGLKAVMFDYTNPSTLPEEMKILGIMVGNEERAEEYNDFFYSTFNLVDEQVEDLAPEDKPRVYYEFNVVSYGNYYKTGGSGSKAHEFIQRAGGVNIFADIDLDEFEPDPEAILESDPQVVIIDAHTMQIYDLTDTSEMEELRELIVDRPGWKPTPDKEGMTAVINDDVYVLAHETMISTHSPVGICYLAKTLQHPFHPVLFSDLDPDAIKREYVENFRPDLEDFLLSYQVHHVYPCKW